MPAYLRAQHVLFSTVKQLRLWGRWNIAVLLFLGIDFLALSVLSEGGASYYLGASLIAGAPVLALTVFLRRHQVDWFSIACFILAAIVSLHFLYISDNWIYTTDLPGHMARIQYTASHWFDLYGYSGWQEHHPPLYYYIAGAVFWGGEATEMTDPWTGVRFLSWCMYLVFNVYGLLTIRRVEKTGILYYVAAALFLFWPLGLHSASKISPEPMYYAFYAASFYHLIVWNQKKDQRQLCMALIFAGLAFAVRTNAVFLFIITGILLAMSAWRGDFRLRACFLKHYVLVSGILIMCILLNIGHVLAHQISVSYHMGFIHNVLSRPLVFLFDRSHYTSFDILSVIRRPFVDFGQDHFFESLLKTSIDSSFGGGALQSAAVLNFLVIFIIIYTIIAWCMATWSTCRGMFPFFLGVLIPLVLLLLFSSINALLAAQHFRYIHPSLVCIVVFFMRSMKIYKACGFGFMQPIGIVLAFGFSLLSVIFFWSNER